MPRRLAASLLLALLLITALVFALGGESIDSAPPASTPTPANATSDPAAPSADDRASQPTERTLATSAPATTAQSRPLLTYPAARATSSLHGLLVEGDPVRVPVADVEVHLTPSLVALHPNLAIADDRATPPPVRTAADGTFHFENVPTGPYRAVATTADAREAAAFVDVPRDPDAGPFTLQLGPAPATKDFTVLVLEPDGRTPVADANVAVHVLTDIHAQVDEGEAPFAEQRTGQDGKAHFASLPRDALQLLARDERGRVCAQIVDEPTSYNLRRTASLLLAEPGSITGTLVGVDDETLRGSRVRALRCFNPWRPHHSCEGIGFTTAVDGHSFAFAALPAGNYALIFESPNGLRLDLPEQKDLPNSVDPIAVEVAANAPTVVPPLRVTAGATLTGLVVTKTGTPVEGARIDLCFAPRTSNEPDSFEIYGAHVWRLDFASMLARNHPEAHRTAITDGRGRYRLAGLHPGKWRIDVFAAGLTHEQRCRVPIEVATPLDLRHELESAGVLQGIGGDLSYVGVARDGEANVAQLAIARSGQFTFPGLAAGEWRVVTPPPRFDGPLEDLARVTIEAGRTTVVDLRRRGHVEIAGRVLFDDGTPVVGTVQLYSHTQQLKPDGAFSFRFRHQLQRTFGLPTIDVVHDGLHRRWTLPESAVEVDRFDGELLVPRHAVRVRVVDENGAPIAATVHLDQHHPYGSWTIAAGEVREIRGFGAGPVGVQAESANHHFEPAVVAAAPGNEVASVREVVVRARSTAAVEVTVFDRAGQALRNFPVAVRVWNGEGARPVREEDFVEPRVTWYSGSTDENGRARVLVPPGLALVGFSGAYALEHPPVPQIVEARAALPVQVVLRLP